MDQRYVYTLRGVDADDLIIIDEMAYIDPDLFYEVILPLIGVNRTRIIGISTPTGETHNFFHRMIELRYPGTDDPVFNSFIVELVCKRCKRLKLYHSCRHMMHKLPVWKGPAKMEITKLLYGPDKEDVRARESLGIALGSRDVIFQEEWVRRFRRRVLWSRHDPQYRPPVIFMACDPNAGGSSHMALVSMCYILDSLVVSLVCIFYSVLYVDTKVVWYIWHHVRFIFRVDARIVHTNQHDICPTQVCNSSFERHDTVDEL